MRWWLIAGAATATLLLASPPASAQGVDWLVAPSMVLDLEHTDDVQVGPGLTAELGVAGDGRVSYLGALALARTDFPVGADELHRNFASLAVGVRLVTSDDGPALGLLLGLGALAWDDVSETDAAFRSSADLEEMLLGGIEARFPVTKSWGVAFSVRDQLTGWFHGILDPEESGVSHRVILAAGLYGR